MSIQKNKGLLYKAKSVPKYQIGGSTGLQNISGRNKTTGLPLKSNFAVYSQAGNDQVADLGSSRGNTNFMYTHRLRNPNINPSFSGSRTYGDIGLSVDANNKLQGKLGLNLVSDPRKNYDSGIGVNTNFNKNSMGIHGQMYGGTKGSIGGYGSNLQGIVGTYATLGKARKVEGLNAGFGLYGSLMYKPKNSPFSINAYGNAGTQSNSTTDYLPAFSWNAGLSLTANLNALRGKTKPKYKSKPEHKENNWVSGEPAQNNTVLGERYKF